MIHAYSQLLQVIVMLLSEINTSFMHGDKAK